VLGIGAARWFAQKIDNLSVDQNFPAAKAVRINTPVMRPPVIKAFLLAPMPYRPLSSPQTKRSLHVSYHLNHPTTTPIPSAGPARLGCCLNRFGTSQRTKSRITFPRRAGRGSTARPLPCPKTVTTHRGTPGRRESAKALRWPRSLQPATPNRAFGQRSKARAIARTLASENACRLYGLRGFCADDCAAEPILTCPCQNDVKTDLRRPEIDPGIMRAKPAPSEGPWLCGD